MTRALPLLLFGLSALAACSPPPVARTAPALLAPASALAWDDRLRIAEAFRLGDAIGDAIWPGWTSAPFVVLLVTPEQEFLVRHPRPSPDFTRIGYDSLLESDVFARARTLSPSLLASFPAAAGVPTIVVGQPSAVGKSSTEWVLSLVHEHFHQLQTSRPGYFARVDSLGLARGDRTGMWMLNYAFPYDSALVQSRIAALAAHLDSMLLATTADERRSHWLAAQVARVALRAVLTPDDDRYLAFQMWQEGVARYTELLAARFAARRYTPSGSFRTLPDFISFDSAASRIEAGIHAGLRAPLSERRRAAFYPLGAAYALALDEFDAGWRGSYLAGEMRLDVR
jgi:hypothetical protein